MNFIKTRRSDNSSVGRLAQMQSEMEFKYGRDTKPRRIPGKELGDGITRLTKPARPTNFLRAGRTGVFDSRDGNSNLYGERKQEKVTQPATFGEISNLVCRYRSKGVTLVAVGKTAEVVRGLFDSSNSRQYLLCVDEEEVENLGLTEARRISFDKFHEVTTEFSGKADFTSFSNKAGQGWITGFGVVYTHINLGEEGGYTLMSENITEFGIPTLKANYLWWRDSGFYDSEMEKDGFYKTTYEFIKEINGSDEDARAMRALVEHATSRSTQSKAALDRALTFVSNKSVFQPFIDQL